MRPAIAAAFWVSSVALVAAPGFSAEPGPALPPRERAAAEAVADLCRGSGDWRLQEQSFWRSHSVLALACYQWPHSFPRVATTQDGHFIVLSFDGLLDDGGPDAPPASRSDTRTAQQRHWDRDRAAHRRELDAALERFNRITEREKLELSEPEMPAYLAFFLSVLLEPAERYLPDEATARRVAATVHGSSQAEPYLAATSDRATLTLRRVTSGFEGDAYAWMRHGPVVRYRVAVSDRGLITRVSQEWLGGQKSDRPQIPADTNDDGCWSGTGYTLGARAREADLGGGIQQCATHAIVRLSRWVARDERHDVLDELRIEPLQLGEEVWGLSCTRAGARDPELIGVGVPSDDPRPRIRARLVFRLSRTRERIEPEDPAGVVCER